MKPMRTYRQIAEILDEREDMPTSPERVAHICRAAETKIVYALLLAELVIRGRLHHGTAYGHEAT